MKSSYCFSFTFLATLGGAALASAQTSPDLVRSPADMIDVQVSAEMLSRRWTNGIVPFTFDNIDHPAGDPKGTRAQFETLERWTEQTRGAVRFVRRQGSESPYLAVHANKDLNSTKGKRGMIAAINGVYELWTKNDTNWRVNHELGHSLGLEHWDWHPCAWTTSVDPTCNASNVPCVIGIEDDRDEDGTIEYYTTPAETDHPYPFHYFVGDYTTQSVMHYTRATNRLDFWTAHGCVEPDRAVTGLVPADDVDTILTLYGVNGDVIHDARWCSDGDSRLYVGDFDGDGYDDLLCHAFTGSRAGFRAIDFAGTGSTPFDTLDWTTIDWQKTSNTFCTGSSRHVVIGDYNGDGSDDMMCYNNALGTRTIDYANSSGQLNGQEWASDQTFCKGSGQVLFVGHFDSDATADHLCYNVSTGRRVLSLAAKGYGASDWSNSTAWCTEPSRHIIVGDFDGDGVDDLMCHDWSNGKRFIDYGHRDGAFNGTDWSTVSDTRGRAFCTGSDRTLRAADVDGDGRHDLICHNEELGTVSVDHSHTNARADGSGLWGQNTFETISFCNTEDAMLHLARLPRLPSRDSLVCHNVATGHQAVRYAEGSNGRYF